MATDTFPWYSPERVRRALIGEAGAAQLEQEAPAYADLFGEHPDDFFFIPVRRIQTEPRQGWEGFVGDAVALTRRVQGGGWTVAARLPARYAGAARLPYEIVIGACGPWPEDWVTAARCGIDPKTGKDLVSAFQTAEQRASRDAYFPKRVGEFVLVRQDRPPYAPTASALGEWAIVRVDKIEDGIGGRGFVGSRIANLAEGLIEERSTYVIPRSSQMCREIPEQADAAYRRALEEVWAKGAAGCVRYLKMAVGQRAKTLRARTAGYAEKPGGRRRYVPTFDGEIVMIRSFEASLGKANWALTRAARIEGSVVLTGRDAPPGFSVDNCQVVQIPGDRQAAARHQYERHAGKAQTRRALGFGIWRVYEKVQRESENCA